MIVGAKELRVIQWSLEKVRTQEAVEARRAHTANKIGINNKTLCTCKEITAKPI